MTRRLPGNRWVRKSVRSPKQGVVDCFWQEADGIVILDFKTDYIDGDLQLKAARYAPQLQAYARALSLIYGLSVRKCILYFFSAGKAVEIDPE